MNKRYFIIDFDSTFVSVETLDELAKIVLENNPHKEKIVKEISEITAAGMEGKITFPESLSKRLSLLPITKDAIEKLIALVSHKITPSVERNKEFFQLYSDYIYIISGGFKEYIYPIVQKYGIKKDHVLANTFIFDKKGHVIGYDTNNLLAQVNGKAKQVKALQLQGEIHIVGDGVTDYEAKKQGQADSFFAFIENVKRDVVLQKANIVVSNFDELLFMYNLPRAYSYPKSKMKVLLLEKIDPLAVEAFQKEGYQIETVASALDEDELCEKIKDVSIVGIRSKTEITKKVVSHAKKLLAIGAFCIGTNQINLTECTEKGITVFNAPYSNTRSVVELAIGEMIMLYRKVFDKSSKLHNGVWEKSAEGSHEIRGKNLGIVGYGSIGSQLSVIAEMLGMHVYFYDIIDKLSLGNARKCSSLQELLNIADVLTIHVDGRKSNHHLISEKEFAEMKNGVLFLNLSRGFIVDLKALANNIKNGKIAGAAVDVFPVEPKSNQDPFISELQKLPNVILTPHIGGSTLEAQRGIAEFVSNKLIDFVNTGNTVLSVNMPQIQLPPFHNAHRFIHFHKNVPGMMAQINEIIAKHSINIEGQYLKTNEEVGYVITDVNKNYDKDLEESFKKIPGTIKLRVLY
jgi:D-3-phosphoglycerate dehydrogenase